MEEELWKKGVLLVQGAENPERLQGYEGGPPATSTWLSSKHVEN